MNIKRTDYMVGDIYRRLATTHCWVLVKILPAQAKRFVLARNGVHEPVTAEELYEKYKLVSEGDGTL